VAVAANLRESLPAVLSDADEGVAEALRWDDEIEADPAKANSLLRLILSRSGILTFRTGAQMFKEDNSMSTTLIDEAKLKELLKAAIVEILEERKDLVREVLEEALEDIALARAVKEGDQSEPVTRQEVFNTLESCN
jgi:DNA polymerase III delta prime subunit